MRLNFFFDIDGTLLPVGKPMPDDAVAALRGAKELGHSLFLCTGRSPFELTDEIRSFPFDGGVFSAGAFVKYGEDTVFHGYITEEQKAFFFENGVEEKTVDTSSFKNVLVVAVGVGGSYSAVVLQKA